jgi:hypothetical protein
MGRDKNSSEWDASYYKLQAKRVVGTEWWPW